MNTKQSLMTFSLLFAIVSWVLVLVVNSEHTIFNNNSFAQNSAATISFPHGNSAGGGSINKPVQFNNYENNQIGVSLKYPSNFLIDESRSNNTLQQISFYPANHASLSLENQILWMDVFVQTINPAPQQQQQQQQQQQPLPSSQSSSDSSLPPSQQSNFDIATYAQNLANFIQQGNQDVTIIEGSNNTLLSGYPAYKLITKSHINNSTIDDVLIATIVNNKVYSLNYQTESSHYLDSLPTANKIIQSFKIISQSPVTGATGIGGISPPLVPSNENMNISQFNSKTANLPLVDNILSSLKLNNLTNNSPQMLNNLKNSLSHSLNNILANSKNTINKSISNPSSIPSTASSSLSSALSSLPSGTLKQVCGIPLISQVCSNNGVGSGVKDGTGTGTGTGIGGFKTENNANNGIPINGTNNNNNNLSNQIENTLKNLLGVNNNTNTNTNTNNNLPVNLTGGLKNVPGLDKLTGLLGSFSNPSSNSSQLSNELSSLFSNLFSSNSGSSSSSSSSSSGR